MKYHFKIEPGPYNSIIMNFGSEFDLLSVFLYSAVYDEKIKDWFISAIDKVLSGESKSETRDGEIYGIIIGPEFTEVYDTFEPEEKCQIETTELRELITIWIDELTKFRAQHHS
jgi:antitoxin